MCSWITAFLLTLVLATPSNSQEQTCERGWQYFDGSCYLFARSNIATHSWYDARDHCNELGAHLLSVHSLEEDNFVKGVLSDSFGGFFNYLWIGLNAIGSDAAFEWSDGTLVNYFELEGDTESLLMKERRCVAIDRLARPMTWNLHLCNNKQSYVCKRPHGVKPSTITPKPTTIAPGNCQSGWVKIGSKCVKIFSDESMEKKNWSEALLSCQSIGPKGHLVTIHNEEEQVQLNKLLLGISTHLWIGVNKQPFSDYRWTDSSRFDFTNWGQGEPTNQHWFDTCGMMQVSPVLPGKWKTSRCKEQLGYVCQIPPDTEIGMTTPMPPTCPTSQSGYLKYGNSCFKIYDGVDERSWDDAEAACQRDNGNLASINNGLEQNYITSILRQNPASTDSLWLGLRDYSSEKIFRWSNKWPVYYTNWGNLQPEKSDHDRCAFMDTYSRYWNTSSCSDKRGFICKVTTDTPPEIPEPSEKVCPPHAKNWTNLGTKYCYYIENGQDFYKRKTWPEAMTFCFQNDATLVSIHSQHDVNIFIPFMQLTNVPLWTGLIKKHHGAFDWEDGTAMDFTLWDDGEPGIFNNPQCGALNTNMKWEAMSCNDRFGFVCKIPTIK